jgi:hypothetical protein
MVATQEGVNIEDEEEGERKVKIHASWSIKKRHTKQNVI